MRYEIFTKFLFDGDRAALAGRLAKLLRHRLLPGVVLKAASARLPPDRRNILALLPEPPGDELEQFSFAATGAAKSLAGTVTVTDPPFTSHITIRFSAAAGFKGAPFAGVEAAKDLLLAVVTAVDAPIGFVEAQDASNAEGSKAFETFRRVDDLKVPTGFEWVTALRADVVKNLGGGGDVLQLATIDGVRVGREGDYTWVVLGDEPFSYAGKVGTAQKKAVERALRLGDLHKKFRRPK